MKRVLVAVAVIVGGIVAVGLLPRTTPGVRAASPPPGTPRYQAYPAPPGMGDSAGEPTLGVDWKTGKVMFKASTSTLRVTFDDCTSPATATWEDRTAPVSATTFDPYLFVDSHNVPNLPNRCFTSDLLPTKTSLMAYSDDDGNNWSPSQGSGINSGVDHQTIGAGPYHAGLGLPTAGQAYPRAVYYCSQDAADANCARSDDGGRTFGPAVPIYNVAQCGGLHGRVRVAPDGTVYVPNRSCGIGRQAAALAANGGQSVAVSEDNGTTWTVRPNVPGSTPGTVDPAVAVGSDGTIYLAMQNGDARPLVATSTDKGRTWSNVQFLGGDLGIKSSTFPVAIAGDADRAAVGFLGTTTAGNYQDQKGFKGEWHLYIATTFDRGATWTVVDATPDDPVQRGSICNAGTTCMNTPDDRNLLDFNEAAMDAEGRVLVGFADGCVGKCVAGGANSFTRKATIVRQSGGRRLLSKFDPVEPAPPAAPRLTGTRDATGGVHLSWEVPDDGGSPITGYRLYRSSAPDSGFQLIASPTGTTYDDIPVDPDATSYYRVTAINRLGESTPCRALNSSEAPLAASPCTPPGMLVLADPAGDPTDKQPAHDVQRIAIAEPYSPDKPENFVFTVKVASLDPPLPNSQWPLVFTAPDGKAYYVAMTTDPTGAVSFEYGTAVFGSTTGGYYGTTTKVGAADAGSGFKPDGTITIVVAKDKIGRAIPGQQLTKFQMRVKFNLGAVALTPDNASDDVTSASGSYDVVGNQSCKPNDPPLAVLAATPRAGEPPLRVRFDAAGSSDPDGDGVASYVFEFGDGATSRQTTPRVTHTYRQAGEYQARLRVADGRGALSVNGASASIEVEGEHEGRLPATGGDSGRRLDAAAAAGLLALLGLRLRKSTTSRVAP